MLVMFMLVASQAWLHTCAVFVTLQLGVTESFSAAQYIALLSEMHQTYCAAPTGTAPARALPPAQLAQAIAAVQALADTPLTPQGKQGMSGPSNATFHTDVFCAHVLRLQLHLQCSIVLSLCIHMSPFACGGDRAGAQSVSTVYVPDEKSVLVPAGELAYNDAPWMAAAGDPTGAAGGLSGAAMGSVRLVHPKISNHIADRCGGLHVRAYVLIVICS